MLKQYLTIGWRSLRKQGLFSAINILGLAAGICFSLLIAAYVREEYSVNSGLSNVSKLYKLESKWADAGMGLELTSLGPLSRELHRQFPDLVKNYYRWDGVTSTVSRGDKVFREGLQIGDSTLLTMFGFKLLQGNAATALVNPFSVVISEEMAQKYFGKKDVAGEHLTIENFSGQKGEFLVTGVMEKPVRNSVTEVNADNNNQFYIPLNTLAWFNRDIERWENAFVVQYLELQPGVSPASLEQPIRQIVKANASDLIAANLTPYLVPMEKYYRVMENGLVNKMVYTVSAIAFFILGMAVINFINISISRAGSRMREIGVRKTLGGRRTQLIGQFLAESILTVSMATIIALVLYVIARPMFVAILGKDIPGLFSFPGMFVLVPVLFALTLGLLAGVYPAFVLAALDPIDSLKGKLGSVGEKRWMRRVMVGFQFCLAAVVFSSALIISRQIDLFFGKDLGYNKEFVLSAQLPRDWSMEGVNRVAAIRDQFARLPEVASASVSFEIPNGNNLTSLQVHRAGTDSSSATTLRALATDEHYLEAYQIRLLAGSFFDGINDSAKVIINEKAATAFGWKHPEDAIGQSLAINNSPGLSIVQGVVRDFHFAGMQQQIDPSVFLNVKNAQIYRFLSLRIRPGNTSASISTLQQKWAALLPGTPFEYRFMDDTLKKIYTTEIRLKKAAGLATALAILIALLGVVGLVALNIQKRMKEIGIRKIVGASVPSIISLFLKDFLVIIIMGALVAVPLAWVLMSRWLHDYAYRVDITATPFVTASVALAVVTSILIVVQTMRAAVSNPVKSLRSE
ncbi:MAG: FtsX-like permease family protein [Chitinophagaceae bacterium]|nr:MAG: FtsX-like permease family protein [Chitinophagaceae bacterium]